MLKLEPAALTDVGRKRSNNQDYLGDLIFKSGRKYGADKLNERGYLFAVADGMGGYAGGEVASEFAITTLFERFYNGPTSGDLGTDLSEAIRAANLKVHTEASGSGRPQMGTTLTGVLVKGNKAIFGNVGDSRTYLIRQGIPERVTHDHSLVQDQIDAGVLTPEQAERSAIKNFITRAIGHRDEVESDLFEREIQKDDVLLLCSDGLHGLVKEIEMGSIVATAPSMEEACRTLVDLANERGGHDNISVMLIRVEEVGEALPPILNGREPIYNTVRSLYNQTTEPLGAVTVPSSGGTSMSERATVPTPVGAAVASPSPYSQQTMPISSSVSETTEKTGGGKGLIFAGLALILIIAAVGAYFLFFNTPTNQPAVGATPAPAVTTAPAVATPTVTAAPTPTTPAPTTAAALPTVTTGPSTTSSNATVLAPGTTAAAAGAVGSSTTAASGATTSGASGGSAANTTAASGPSSGTSRPEPTDSSGSGTNSPPVFSLTFPFSNCPNAGTQGNLTCWAVSNLGNVNAIVIRLTNPSGNYTIKLVQQNVSNPATIDLIPSPTGGGFYFTKPLDKLTKGNYSLQIVRQDTNVPEAFDIKLGETDAEAWAAQNVKVNQQLQVMVIEVKNKP